jgi:hypothetical protein
MIQQLLDPPAAVGSAQLLEGSIHEYNTTVGVSSVVSLQLLADKTASERSPISTFNIYDYV